MKQQLYQLFSQTSELSLQDITINIIMAAVMGFVIFLSYALSHRGTIYSRKFNASLVMLTVLTGTVMTVIGNNIALSLGMVGALSIVRFRTAIKEPLDIAFIFWSISVGIICGAHLYSVAIIGSVFVTIVMVIIQLLPGVKPALLLIINASSDIALKDLENLIASNTSYYKIKSRNITSSELDIIAEIRTQDEQAFIKLISDFNGINNATIMLHDGEVIC